MIEERQGLEELLSDPMIRLIMASDRVKPEEVRVMFGKARDRAEASVTDIPAAHVIDKVCLLRALCA